MLEKIWAWIVLNPTLSLGIAGIIGGAIEGARRTWNKLTARSEKNAADIKAAQDDIKAGRAEVKKCISDLQTHLDAKFTSISAKITKLEGKVDANEQKNSADHALVMQEIADIKADVGFVKGKLDQ